MPTIEITAENIKTTVESNDIVLVDFWAEWCGPCRAFAPVFEEAADENEDIVFGKCDTSTQAALAAAFQIRSIPTLMVFKGGVHVSTQAGMLPKPALDELIAKVRQLDSSQLREQSKQEK
jgi:thioredoxin